LRHVSLSHRSPTRQSERIRDPSYRRRTTWSLPEIVSGVAPASLIGGRSHNENVHNSFEREERHEIRAIASTSLMNSEEGLRVGETSLSTGRHDFDDGNHNTYNMSMFFF